MSTARYFTCNLCEALCGLRVTMEADQIVDVRGNPDDVFSHGHICPKGPALAELLTDPDRLRRPLKRTASGWQEIGWDAAFDEAAQKISAVQKKYGKDAVALYIGNPTAHSHRAALGSQLISLALSTKNRFDPNSQDSNPRLFACMQVYGDGLSIPVPDVDRTDYLLILGANPAASNGSQMSLGDVRKRLRGIRSRGGKIVLIDPRRTETAAWSDEHHFIRPGGDAALLLALLFVLFSEKRVAEDRTKKIASGLDQLEAIALGYPPERVGEVIGVPPEVIRRLARELSSAPRAVVYGRIGICQGEFGPLASWLIEALNVVTGNFDREGGVMFPRAAADVGPLARRLIGNNFGRWRSRVRGLPEFLGSLPSAVMAEEMETGGAGQIRALVCFAGNPVLSTPNGTRLAAQLAGLDFMLAVDFYRNESTRHAHLIFPAAHVMETGNYDLLMLGLTVRNLAKYSPPILHRGNEAYDDWEILNELAMRLVLPGARRLHRLWRRLARDLPEQIVDFLIRSGPYGDRYLGKKGGLSLEVLRNTPQGIDLGPLMPSGRSKVFTPDGRVRLAPQILIDDLPRLDRWLEQAQSPELVLIGRRHLRSNNSWMHNLSSLVKGPDRSQLTMNPKDALRLGLSDGAQVEVESRSGVIQTRLSLSSDMMLGVVSLPHGFGHSESAGSQRVAGRLLGANKNALTESDRVEPVIGTSILNGVSVVVRALSGPGRVLGAALFAAFFACAQAAPEIEPLSEDQWGLLTCPGRTSGTTCFTHRGIIGVSMGAGGAGQIGLSRPELFDSVGMLGSPLVDLSFMLRTVERSYMGGFCDRATILSKLDALADPIGAPFCGPVQGEVRMDPEGKVLEPSQDFNHWYTFDGDGPGKSFDRQTFRDSVKDLSLAFGNPGTYNPDSPYLPPGIDPSYLSRSDQERCADPPVLEGVVHHQYNPDGQYPVIVPCDSSTESGNFDPTHPADVSSEVLLSVDYNRNRLRDYAEPVLMYLHEPFDDLGNLPDDAFNWQENRGGTAKNWLYDPGEPYRDFGLDGVDSTHDFGEGNGRFDYNPNVENWLANSPRRLVTEIDLAQLERINIWADAGIRDFLISAGATNWLWAALQNRVGPDRARDHANFRSLLDAKEYDFLAVDYTPEAIGKHAYLRYGDPDASPSEIQAGDGNHVGQIDKVLNRFLTALAFFESRIYEPDRRAIPAEDIFGLLRRETYFSDALAQEREFGIALPPGYDLAENAEQRYPVVFFLHGQGQESEQLLSSSLLFYSYMAQSVRAEQMRRQQSDWAKFILVFPDALCRQNECSSGSFNANHRGVKGDGARFLDAFFELMVHVEKNYRVRAPLKVPIE